MNIGYTILPKKSTLKHGKKIFLVVLHKVFNRNVNGRNLKGEISVATCIKNALFRQISK